MIGRVALTVPTSGPSGSTTDTPALRALFCWRNVQAGGATAADPLRIVECRNPRRGGLAIVTGHSSPPVSDPAAVCATANTFPAQSMFPIRPSHEPPAEASQT